MSKKDVACFWIILLLCQELRTDLIAEMGPSSGILIQETPGFILTEKRILTRRVFVSLDPKISIEKAYNISSMQLPELQTWYQMHLQRAQDRVRNILEQARKPFCIQFYSDEQPTQKVPHRYNCCISLCHCRCSCRNWNVCSQLYYCPKAGYGNLCDKATH
ncbi:Hypothetical predicted protein [Pelobates cultripes]|uniref:Uncharacterized protein n=1 Tax=Pelobates cultripes TaxID=61616 RepID=A0AAD1VR92_PELCU|nr:Hypothetical predicted protein [Pelobates cultripes]